MSPHFANGAEDYFGSRYSGRAVSIGLVLLVHAAILAILLYEKENRHDASEPREMILRLFPMAQPTEPTTPNRKSRLKREAPQTLQLQSIPRAVPSEPDVRALGRALNGCNLEDLDKLAPEERSKCIVYRNQIAGGAAKEQSAVNAPSRSLNAPVWAEAIRRRNIPIRVDCVNVGSEALGVQQSVKSTAIMFDVPCVLRHLARRQSPLN